MKAIQRARAGAAWPTIIALHASGGSGVQWRALAKRARQDFDVLAPDLYGHGSAANWHGAAVDVVAADTERIARFAAAAGRPVHLVGHSYGGAIALRVALQHPECVASVAVYEPVVLRVLFDYNRKHQGAAEVAQVAEGMRRAINGGDFEHAAERFVDYWAGKKHWVTLAPERQAAIASRVPAIHSHFVSLRADPFRLRDYAKLEVPVLYLSGRDTRASALRIAELLQFALRDVEHDVLSDMGHLGPITHAEAVAERIAGFVQRRAATWIGDERKAA